MGDEFGEMLANFFDSSANHTTVDRFEVSNPQWSNTTSSFSFMASPSSCSSESARSTSNFQDPSMGIQDKTLELSQGNSWQYAMVPHVSSHTPFYPHQEYSSLPINFPTNQDKSLVMRNGPNVQYGNARQMAAPYQRRRKVAGRRISSTTEVSSTEDSFNQRAQANIRERQRTKLINEALAILKKVVPSLPSDKLSKIQILRLATSYIFYLTELLKDDVETDYDPIWAISKTIAHEKLRKSFCVWRMSRSQCMDPLCH